MSRPIAAIQLPATRTTMRAHGRLALIREQMTAYVKAPVVSIYHATLHEGEKGVLLGKIAAK